MVALCVLMRVVARAQSEASVKEQLRDDAVRKTRDPSLTTRLAVPLVDFSAELAKDKKTASAKVGFDFGDDLVAEVEVTGAFDESSDRTALTSLRELTPGSKLWASINWRSVPREGSLLKARTSMSRGGVGGGQVLHRL